MPRLTLFLLLMCCILAHSTPSRAQQAPTRILRVIDFEERRLGNGEELPMHWSKVQAAHFPHYVNARLAPGRSRSGRYAFRFDLNGGSLLYRYDVGQIRVQPRAHYRVETHVQTTLLKHARARLTAHFVDIDGRAIDSSIRHSPLYAAVSDDQHWERLEVNLSAGREAHWLVIELGLLQPALYGDDALGGQTLFPQDIRGAAWFDDVVVSQVPRVRLGTDRPGNIFRRGEILALDVLVNDRSTDDLAAQLVIRDAGGKDVYQRTGALDAGAEIDGPGQKRVKLVLPPLYPGWYRANLLLTSQGQLVGREHLDFVLLADLRNDAPPMRPDERFGIIATGLPLDGWHELPDILPFLGAGRVKLAVWNRQADAQQHNSAAFDQLLTRLQELLITPTACITALPPRVAQRAGGHDLHRLLHARLDDWQPQLAYMVSRHANKLHRWQLGDDGDDAFVNQPEMRQVFELVHGEFASLIESPNLAIPWPAWYEVDARQAHAPPHAEDAENAEAAPTLAISVPPGILPHQLPLYMQGFQRAPGQNLSLSLEPLDAEQYGREVQIRDFAQRMIYALAADVQRLDVPLPFTVIRDEDHVVRQPQELFLVVRTIVTTLAGARFRARVPVGEGVEAFLFERAGQGILAMWNRQPRAGSRQLSLVLGQQPRAIDLWGNVTPLLRPRNAGGGPPGEVGGGVQLSVGQMPLFLVDIDSELAQFRASVGIDRPFIESSFAPHRRRVRFTNPWRQSISGTLRLRASAASAASAAPAASAGWTISPPTINFSLNPGETFEPEITLEFPYNSFAGARQIDAHFELQGTADRPVSLRVPITVTLGLSDVGVQTLAVRQGNDIIVQQIITNYGDKPIDYTAFAILPGQARQERLVTGLAPGRTTIKTYRFPTAPTLQSRVRTGIKELRGTRILNEEVEIH